MSFCFTDQSLASGTSDARRILGYDVPRRSMPPVAVVNEPVYETLCHVRRNEEQVTGIRDDSEGDKVLFV